MWITKNYLLDVIKPVKEIETIKMILVNIKSNFKKQAQNWRENWSVLVNTDNQKSLPLKQSHKFKLKEQNKLKINPKHSVYYTLL